ncbi:MAG TPA: hypothetical protein VHS99_23385 [Chloroflexota bacterium]|jgi:hypothetical protein|nr:hypothetical protein [Chloroflexota bacterium]
MSTISVTEAPITTTTPAEAGRVVAVVSLAFSADPAARWLSPDPQQYWTHWPGPICTDSITWWRPSPSCWPSSTR